MAREPEPTEISVLSTEYVHVPISAVDFDTGAAVPLSALVVELAFVADQTDPGDDDWHVAEWNDPADKARLLIGPGVAGTPYPVGEYVAWWRITDLPEVPIDHAPGLLVVS